MLTKPIRARSSHCPITSWRVSWRFWKQSSRLELCNQLLVSGQGLQQQQPQSPVAIETKASQQQSSQSYSRRLVEIWREAPAWAHRSVVIVVSQQVKLHLLNVLTQRQQLQGGIHWLCI